MVENVGSVILRKENVEAAVKGFALQEYKIKNVVTVISSSSWKETYFQESSTELTGGTGNNIRGIPRLAAFPFGRVAWTKVSATIEKYGMEGIVSYEDAITDDIDAIGRTLLRISRGVVKSVEDQIYDVLSESFNGGSGSQTNINSVTAVIPWNSPIVSAVSGGFVFRDINQAVRKIEVNNYDMDSGGVILLSPTDYESMMNDVYRQGASAPKFGEMVLGKRKIPTIAGLGIIKSNSVTISGALVLKMGDCATWKAVTPLTTDTEYSPGISWRIRAWELGVTQLINPKSICIIIKTQA
jgi:hypothetical protein